MAAIRSFTSLKQSRKLAEILPIESADMVIWGRDLDVFVATDAQKLMSGLKERKMNYLPCWSLAALLEVLKQHCERLETTLRLNKNYNVFASGDGFTYRTFDEYPDGISNLIDAYYKIVIRLNELNLL